MDIATIKQRQQAAWASGDYAAVGARLYLTSELLCEAVDLRAGQRVLDVACGSGNASLAAARRFCPVVGVDYVPALLERARRADRHGQLGPRRLRRRAVPDHRPLPAAAARAAAAGAVGQPGAAGRAV